MATAKSSSSAFLRSFYIGKSAVLAYLGVGATVTNSAPAYLTGRVLVRSSKAAYLGSSGGTQRSSLAAYIPSAVVRSSLHTYSGGTMTEYSFIWLKTSDGGATKSKKFRVLAQGYDDGTPEKAETLERTLGGGLNLNMGAIYTTWSPIIKVRHEETETDYGNMQDLIDFFNLNNPNATPSNKITFVDHHGMSRVVYMLGNLKKSIVGCAVEGQYAWFNIAVRMIEVQ